MAEDNNQELRRNMLGTNDFAHLQKLILADLKNYPYQTANRFIGKYRREDIANYLSMPELFYNQLQLRYISKYLYNVSSHYRRLVNYFSSILTLDYIVEPYQLDVDKADKKKMKKAYQKAIDLVESMNLKHELQKVMTTAFKEDTFYGYVHASKDSFFIQPLNPDFCKISSIEDGVYNFAFDFTYFQTYPNRLYMFPEEFQEKNSAYEKDGTLRWQEISSKSSICIKINEDLEYSLPPFVGIFGNLLDIQDFKDLEKQRVEIGNYKILTQRIPLRQDSSDNNDFAITLDVAKQFHANIASTLPEQIGLVTSPMEIDEIDFERDHPDINKVEQATKEFWDASGVSQLLFSGDSGSIAMNNSIRTDEVVAFNVLRQLERWTNRFLKNFNSAQYKFRVRFLDVTVFNREDWFGFYMEASQYGLPVKSHVSALLGNHPSSLLNMQFLENDVLALHENLIPLQSTHTMGEDGPLGGAGGTAPRTAGRKGGGVSKPKSKLSDEGAKTQDKLKNKNKAK